MKEIKMKTEIITELKCTVKELVNSVSIFKNYLRETSNNFNLQIEKFGKQLEQFKEQNNTRNYEWKLCVQIYQW